MRYFLGVLLFMCSWIMVYSQGLVSSSQVDQAKNQAILFTLFATVMTAWFVFIIIKRRRNRKNNK